MDVSIEIMEKTTELSSAGRRMFPVRNKFDRGLPFGYTFAGDAWKPFDWMRISFIQRKAEREITGKEKTSLDSNVPLYRV